MRIERGKGVTEFGPGVNIVLTGDEVARAVRSWLYAQGVYIQGSSTVLVNSQFCKDGLVYVDPEGSVVADGVRHSGRG